MKRRNILLLTVGITAALAVPGGLAIYNHLDQPTPVAVTQSAPAWAPPSSAAATFVSPTPELSESPEPTEEALPTEAATTTPPAPSPSASARAVKGAYVRIDLTASNSVALRQVWELTGADTHRDSDLFAANFSSTTAGAGKGRFRWYSADNLIWAQLFLIDPKGKITQLTLSPADGPGTYIADATEAGGFIFEPAKDADRNPNGPSSVVFNLGTVRQMVLYGGGTDGSSLPIDPDNPVRKS